MVHLFPISRSVYGPPPGQLVVHLPFGTIKIVVWEQFWHHRRGWSLNEIIGFFGCRLLKIVAGHRDGREKAQLSLIGLLQGFCHKCLFW